MSSCKDFCREGATSKSTKRGSGWVERIESDVLVVICAKSSRKEATQGQSYRQMGVVKANG